jgi:SAM-dependent methyltransferase
MPFAALKASRERFLDRHRDADDWRNRLFSAATLALWRAARPLTVAASSGRVLDAGSGRGSWRRVILAGGGDYESIDVAPRGDDRPTWIGDIMAMPQVPDGRYDCVVSHQVLEHLPRPWRALAEFHRVLRPGGRVVLSAPHLSRRHELPHDYFRFTQEGMHALLEDAGFVDIEVRPVGGTLCFLHHQASCIVPGLVAPVPGLGAALAALNAIPAWLCVQIDRHLDAAALSPLGVLATAHRPAVAVGRADAA